MRNTLAIMALLSLAACGTDTTTTQDGTTTGTANDTFAQGDTTAGMATGAEAETPTQGARYVEVAGASDLFEIQSSELALERTQSDDVRQFAQMMIEQHQMTTEQVTNAAREAGITPTTPQLNAMQQDMMSQLRSAQGAEFDRTYLQQQRQAHQMALELHRNFAERGDTQQLQQVANEAVGIVERHISELEDLNAS